MIGTLRRAPGGKVGRAAVIAAVAAAAMLAPAAAWAHVTVDRTQPNVDLTTSDVFAAAALISTAAAPAGLENGADRLEVLIGIGTLTVALGAAGAASALRGQRGSEADR